MAEDRYTDYGRSERERERNWRAGRSEERGGYFGGGRGNEDRTFGNERARQGGYGEYGGDIERGYSRYGGYGQDYAYAQPAQERFSSGREIGYGRRDFDTGRPQAQSFRGRGPKGYRRSDERIREDVSDRLADDHWLDASQIEIAVTNGEVILAGAVDSREDKRRAEILIEEVSGVDNVQNNLRVQPANLTDRTAQANQTNQTGQTGRA